MIRKETVCGLISLFFFLSLSFFLSSGKDVFYHVVLAWPPHVTESATSVKVFRHGAT